MAPADSDPPLFHQETITLYIPLAPSSLSNAYAHICAERFSPLLLSYYPPARGVVLSFSNVRLSATRPTTTSQSSPEPLLAKSADEYSASFLWVTVDFLVYRLQRDVWLEGRVKVQTETHVTLSHLNALSVYIPRAYIPGGWRWIADPAAEGLMDTGDGEGKVGHKHGYYVDEGGEMVDRKNVSFLVRDFDMRPRTKNNKGYVKIDGSLLGAEGERDEVQESVAEREGETFRASMDGHENVKKKKKKRDKDDVESSEKKRRDKDGLESSEKKKKRKKNKDGTKSQTQPIEVS